MKSSILLRGLAVFLGLLTFVACQEQKPPINYPPTDLSESVLIPLPLEVTPTNSAFGLDQKTAVITVEGKDDFAEVGAFLVEKMGSKIGLRLGVNTADKDTERIIYITQSDTLALDGDEAYILRITNDSLILSAKTAAGAFRGVQTLRQLIPETSNDTLAEQPMWLVPSGIITDEPQFIYRGAMLDVARHFFSVAEVKRFIDLLAYYKYNALHLHLSDDQGWRIEIKSWPKLTSVGGLSEVGGGKGGFFTQEDYSEIVAYAAKHHIMIVPEIDMPGHTNAASVSYPILNGNGKVVKPYMGTRVGFSTFDARKDTVYQFIDDVVGEIAALSPSPYFHIGGDESHVTKKNDYIHFVERVEKIVQKHGKQMVGWDEIMQANVDSTSIAQHWNTIENAVAAAKNGSKIILSPAKKAYLDMQYDSLSIHGLHWAAYIPVDSAYTWTPKTYIEGIDNTHILGIEAPLWSETISNSSEMEYLAFPRAIGYAELGWTPASKRNWETYKVRLAHQAAFLERFNVNFYRTDKVDWVKNKNAEIPITKD